ncbi:MAG TPA: DUF2911 domain-containing protein [Thermoanaerobaculia bacterium]|nr:DUF2911 domain-containing protein [Thermoanaerobaculia bacterium]
MHSKRVLVSLIMLAALLAAIPSFAQLKLPRPSQHATVSQTIGLTDVTITYSRPGVKARQIWGGLVPYDQVWRTGANEATQIVFSDDVTINGQPLPKGSYSLHTIPGKDTWTIIINTDDKQWGSYSYDKAKDALRVTAKPEKAEFREWLTFEFPEVSTDSAKVVIRWENLAVPFTVGTNTTAKAMANIHAAIEAAKPDDWRVLMNGARFAYDNKVSTDDAAKWLDQSIKINENISNLWLKAQVQAKSGDKAAAVASAEKAIAKAEPKDGEVASEIKKSVAQWKK